MIRRLLAWINPEKDTIADRLDHIMDEMHANHEIFIVIEEKVKDIEQRNRHEDTTGHIAE